AAVAVEHDGFDRESQAQLDGPAHRRVGPPGERPCTNAARKNRRSVEGRGLRLIENGIGHPVSASLAHCRGDLAASVIHLFLARIQRLPLRSEAAARFHREKVAQGKLATALLESP